MSIYEASRDLIRAQNLPWYKDYLHPSLEEYYKPSHDAHGTFWIGWTDDAGSEVAEELPGLDGRACASSRCKGGLITTGDDAGYLYGSLYGFGISRELELQRGSRLPSARGASSTRPSNGAKLLGMEDRLGTRPRGLHRRPARRQRQPARESAAAEPVRHRRDALNGTIVDNYSALVKPGRSERQAWCTAAASSGRSRTASRTTCRR